MFTIGIAKNIRISGKNQSKLYAHFDFLENKQFLNLTHVKDCRNKSLIRNLYNLLHTLDNHTLNTHKGYSEMIFTGVKLFKISIYYLPTKVQGLKLFLNTKSKTLFVEDDDGTSFERNKSDPSVDTNKSEYDQDVKYNRINKTKLRKRIPNKPKYQKKPIIALVKKSDTP